MIGLAAAGLSMAKNMATNPAARVALCTAHTTVSLYLTHYSIKQSIESAKDTRDATVTAAQAVRPQFQAVLAKARSIRTATEQAPTGSTAQSVAS